MQTAYLILLTAAYATTEFGRAYPLTRGLSVLGITVVAVAVGAAITMYSVIDGVGVRTSDNPFRYVFTRLRVAATVVAVAGIVAIRVGT